MMKRMAELEERMVTMNKPASLPPEKEEMLKSAISRADVLEQELNATKKVNIVGFHDTLFDVYYFVWPHQIETHTNKRN